MKKDNLKEALEELVVEYKKKLSAQAKIDKTHATGRFAKSFESKVTEDGFEITSNVPYAGTVDGGSRSASSKEDGVRKKDRIREWARMKGLRPYRRTKTGATKFSKITDASMKSMVYMIAKTISEKGTIKRFNHKGSGIFDTVYKSISKKIGVEIGSAYSKDIQEELRKTIDKFNTNR
jgi:hypothetical protein